MATALTFHRIDGADWAARFGPAIASGAQVPERYQTRESIRHILSPRSVVVIGASRNPQKIGSRILEEIRNGGFTGALYVVHREAATIQGIRTAPSVSALPTGIDLAIVSVPACNVLNTVADCGRAGVRAVVVVSAGFSESGPTGRLLQHALLDLVHDSGMRLVGPNSLGVVNLNPAISLHAACASVLPAPGGISLASQSGALGIAVLDLAAERELGLSSFVSVGNKADVSSNDLLEYWEGDPATRVVLLHMESFGNPLRFARIARRVAVKKPIVALKAGLPETGARSRRAASLANHDAVLGAMFERSGVIGADRVDDMFDIAACLDRQPLPHGRRVAVVSNAGGAGILAADACAVSGLRLASFNESTWLRLTKVLPAASLRELRDGLVPIHGPAAYRATMQAV